MTPRIGSHGRPVAVPPMLSLLKSFSCINGQHFVHWHGGRSEKITQREKDLIDAAYLLGRQHEIERRQAEFSDGFEPDEQLS